ncbi:hypothetical protein GUITHDRAFT_134074 [Guillardia theta CCMP2712]|uniref:PA14 domain-containing protein n=1 Tax=Guillardia theta (strain CCMP2712) TaxID=905079 RepID=L1JUD4_GUITC|nr:hypothetical protein GUITHDRAFT_134074 [Guillardia theta CCMP2712]EKX51703.1 hypothetical protein GUITHDRAFT_134074 [Guillardia theta CCMP2712]|eukprot:XP_005838683.1 hypothetical protein GUITHDRAFT_134074 [Guillardia theta CCMP2712]
MSVHKVDILEPGVIGIARDGVVIYHLGMNSGAVPSIDSCGGVLFASGLYAYVKYPSCLLPNPEVAHSPLVGFMLDGIPIYGPLDVGGAKAEDIHGRYQLDECGGHVDSQNNFYHYHYRSKYPFSISCFRACLFQPNLIYRNPYVAKISQDCKDSDLKYSYHPLDNLAISVINNFDPQAHLKLSVFHGGRNMTYGKFYDFKLQFEDVGIGSFFDLKWANEYQSPTHIPDALFFFSQDIMSNDISMLILPGLASTATSTTSAQNGSSYRVGIWNAEVVTRDRYGNRCSSTNLTVVSWIELNASIVNCTVIYQGSGNYRVSALVTRSGSWNFNVLVNERLLDDSPKVLIFEPGSVDAKISAVIGNCNGGLEFIMTRGQVANFLIQPKDSFGNNVTTTSGVGFSAWLRKDLTVHNYCPIYQLLPSLYSASCLAYTPGLISLEVVFQLHFVGSTPLQVYVEAGSTCAGTSRVYGPLLTLSTVGIETFFFIETRDALYFNKNAGGDQFFVSFNSTAANATGSVLDASMDRLNFTCNRPSSMNNPSIELGILQATLEVFDKQMLYLRTGKSFASFGDFILIDSEIMSVVSSSSNSLVVQRGQFGGAVGIHLPGSLIYLFLPNCEAGKYVTYVQLTVSGTYVVTVSLGGFYPLHGSPFVLRVRPAAFSLSNNKVVGEGLTLATAGFKSHFQVLARDLYGNVIEAFDDQIVNYQIFDTYLQVVFNGSYSLMFSEGMQLPVFLVQYYLEKGSCSCFSHSLKINGTDIIPDLQALCLTVVPQRASLSNSFFPQLTNRNLSVGTPALQVIDAFNSAGQVQCLNRIASVEILYDQVQGALVDASQVKVDVTCILPCTGSGFSATFDVQQGEVGNVRVLDCGCGYDPKFPPQIGNATFAPGVIFRPVFQSQSFERWSITYSALLVSGLRATFYESEEFTVPAFSGPWSNKGVQDVLCLTSGSIRTKESLGNHLNPSVFGDFKGFLILPNQGYTSISFAATGSGQRVKLWIDESIVIDTWTSLGAWIMTYSFTPSQASSAHEIHIRYKGTPLDCLSLKWNVTTIEELIPLQAFASQLHVTHPVLSDMRNGSYQIEFSSTKSGIYSNALALTYRGGLSATYIPNKLWQLTGNELRRVDPEVNFVWGSKAPMANFPSDDFSVIWEGFLQPKVDDIYQLHFIADDSIVVYFDGQKVLNTSQEEMRVEYVYFVTYPLLAQNLYQIKILYKEEQVHANARMLWSTNSMAKELISSSYLFYSTEPSRYFDSYILASNLNIDFTASKAVGQVPSKVTAGDSATFTAFYKDQFFNPTFGANPDGFFFVARALPVAGGIQSFQIDIVNGGLNYIPGSLRIEVCSQLFYSNFNVSSVGSINSIDNTFFDCGEVSHEHGLHVTPLYSTTNTLQGGSVTSVSISGTASLPYKHEGNLIWNCSGITDCEGFGLAGICYAASGNVTSVVLIDHGSNFSSIAKPSVYCEDGSGQEFQVNIAEGALFLPMYEAPMQKAICNSSDPCADMNVASLSLSVSLTRAGTMEFSVATAFSGGLQATYYLCSYSEELALDCGTPAKTVIDAESIF